jgi:dephospho-CoA kinase
VGLTGGIGSGKSTVAKMLAQWGAVVLDADQISRSLTLPMGAAIPLIGQAFGPEAITPEGAMDRAKMRELVFSDPVAKSRLEAILHPLVESTLLQKAQESTSHGVPLIVLDIPLLAESTRWQKRLDRILVIECSEETQVARVQARSQLPPEQTLSIIRTQASPQARRALADWTILNDQVSLPELEDKVRLVFDEAQVLAKSATL